MKKRYTVKVYDKTGAIYKGSYGQLSDYKFTKTINGGVGELKVTLPRKFDDYNAKGDCDLLDRVELWVQDKDTNGQRIYSGYIDEIETYVGGGKEGVDVTILGYVTRFGFQLDWDGLTLQSVRNSMDPSNIAKDIIDNYNSVYSNPFIDYSVSSVETSGLTASYTSDSKYINESLDRVLQMCPADWFWYVDADDVFHWRSKPTAPTHKFTFKKDLFELKKKKSASDIVNNLLFWNGLQEDDTNFLSKLYYSPSSTNSYWDRYERLTDSRITNGGTADLLGNAFVDANKDPNISLQFRVIDNNLSDDRGYDIESVSPGDTCQILNLGDEDLYSGNMIITRVDYTPEYIDVFVEDKRELMGRRLTDIRRSLDSAVYGDGVGTVNSVDTD